MMKTIKLICILAVMILLINKSNAQDSLHHYLNLAAENNPGLKAKFYDYQAALEKVPQVGALPDPQVGFGYFIQPVETRVGPQQAKLSVSQMFPWFGSLQARENVAVQEAKAKYEDFHEIRARLFYEVKSAWYRLYFTNRSVEIISNNVRLLKSFKDLALIKIESGSGSAVDELRIEMELADLNNQLSLSNDEFKYRTTVFYNLINADKNTKIIIPDSLHESQLELSGEEVQQKILMSNPQLLALDYLDKKFENEQLVGKKSGLPSFSLGIDYIFTGQSDNPALSDDINGRDAIVFPKLSFNLPIYRGKYKARVRQSELRQLSTRETKTDKENKLQTIYEKNRRDYNDADRRIDLYESQLQTAGKVLRLLESDYSTRGVNFIEALRVERKKLWYTLQLEKARVEKQTAIAFFQYLMGE